MSKIAEKYNQLTSNNSVFKFKPVRAHLPKPTDGDYLVGYIVRYFAQKINERTSAVIEISEETSRNSQYRTYYNIVSLRWRITGPTMAVIDKKGKIIDKGVPASNRSSINLASAGIMPNLKNYLGNLIQFYKK
jgi:hypothetical protein